MVDTAVGGRQGNPVRLLELKVEVTTMAANTKTPVAARLPALAGLLCRQLDDVTLVCTEVEAWLLRSITVGAGVGGA